MGGNSAGNRSRDEAFAPVAVQERRPGLNTQHHQTIVSALAAELQRQALGGAHRVDMDALAEAVEHALDDDDHLPPPAGEGRRPEDLNSANDG